MVQNLHFSFGMLGFGLKAPQFDRKKKYIEIRKYIVQGCKIWHRGHRNIFDSLSTALGEVRLRGST